MDSSHFNGFCYLTFPTKGLQKARGPRPALGPARARLWAAAGRGPKFRPSP